MMMKKTVDTDSCQHNFQITNQRTSDTQEGGNQTS